MTRAAFAVANSADHSAGMRPDPAQTVSEWADANRILNPRASAEPGPWRTSRVPYLREIMDCLSPSSPVERVVIMAGAQVGKTEAGLNWCGYVVDRVPGPMLAIQPTVELAKRWSRQRLTPMLDDCPALAGKVPTARRDAGNTMTLKEFPGGIIIVTGANAASGLRSMPARYLFGDEIDRYPIDVEGEGDPVELGIARTKTFARRKILLTSTPTIAGASRIAAAYDESDRRRYHVACPECGVRDWLRWTNMTWTKGKPETAAWCCPACGCEIAERHKAAMLAGGVWIAENPGGRVAGFHLSSLYSPPGWTSWAELAATWERVHKTPPRLRVFVNTELAETWQERGEAPDADRLYERRESYKIGVVPAGAALLTAGADVQRDRIECEIVGWGVGLESWSIDYVTIPGDTSTAEPWDQLAALLGRRFQTEAGRVATIRAMCVDSGDQTQTVYKFARRFRGSGRVFATKGHDDVPTIVGKTAAVDVKADGQRIARGLRLWHIGVSVAKRETYGFLRIAVPDDGEPYPEGFMHFPEYPREFFDMLTAEELRRETVRGFARFRWVKTKERNEALDCRVLARAAAAIVGADRLTPAQWAAMLSGLPKAPEPGAPSPPAPPASDAGPRIKRKPSEYWNR